MSKPDCFLRHPLAGGDVRDDVAVHLRLIAQFVPPACMPRVHSDGDRLVCRFSEWAALDGFLAVIAEHACEEPSMIPYLTHRIDWRVSLDIGIDTNDFAVWAGSSLSVRPTLHLERAAVVALALTLAYSCWFEEGEDRSLLIPHR